jgi:hypothetical protein
MQCNNAAQPMCGCHLGGRLLPSFACEMSRHKSLNNLDGNTLHNFAWALLYEIMLARVAFILLGC